MAVRSTNRDLKKQQQWLEQVRRWQQSGLSQMEFCRREGLHDGKFYSWRSVLKKRGLVDDQPETGKLKSMSRSVAGAPACFVPVDVKPTPIQVNPPKDGLVALEIVTPGGYVVRIP